MTDSQEYKIAVVQFGNLEDKDVMAIAKEMSKEVDWYIFEDDADGYQLATKNDIANASYSLPKASSSVLGGVKIGSHITVNDGVISITEEDVVEALGFTPVGSGEVGKANGIAQLGSDGKVPSSQLPSYVDDVVEATAKANFPTEGETGKIYVDKTTNKTYRWSGTQYVEISASLALGTTSSTAYRGDHGLIAYNHSQAAHAPSNAQANVIETIKVAGTALAASSKAVDITLSSFGITATKDEINDVTNKLGRVSSSASLSGILTGNGTLNGVSGSGKSFESTLTDNDNKVPTSKAVTTAINALHKLFTGSTTPTGMKSGDVWLQYSQR